MAYSRNDPGSLSFGARLKALEAEAVVNQRRVKDLEEKAPTAAQQLDLKEQRAYRRQERARANQLIASYDSTSEDFAGLDRSTLTKAQAELVDQRLTAAKFAEASPRPFVLSPEAGLRLQNWRNEMQANPGTAFALNNLNPQQITPQSAFERWTTNINSPEGRAEEQRRNQHSEDMQLNQRRLTQKKSPKKRAPKGGTDMSSGERT